MERAGGGPGEPTRRAGQPCAEEPSDCPNSRTNGDDNPRLGSPRSPRGRTAVGGSWATDPIRGLRLVAADLPPGDPPAHETKPTGRAPRRDGTKPAHVPDPVVGSGWPGQSPRAPARCTRAPARTPGA